MTLQFRVLYREFLFRMVDLEMLAERADVARLLSQLTALLAALSFTISLSVLRYAFTRATPEALLISAWSDQHFLIATTMAVVGLFAVLSWDSAFPDRRDVLVLAPLPIRASTMFFAKIAALASALALTVVSVNSFTGLAFPLVFIPLGGGFFAGLRTFAAHWATLFAAGAFLFCSLLAIQGISAQLLSRRHFLRWSAFLQLAAFCIILCVYFLQPAIATPAGLSAERNQALLTWLPSYWFLGLFHALNGDLHPVHTLLAWRAVVGLAVAAGGASLAFLLSYFRTLRKTVEEPDILPGRRRASFRLPFGDSLRTAIVLFSLRTVLRSRQHRVILAGYLGVGSAIALAYLKSLIYGYAADPWWRVNIPLLVASVVMLCFSIVGVRAVFDLPIALRANWIFRVTAVHDAELYFRASWLALFAIACLPVLLATAATLAPIWPAAAVAGHLLLLGALASILVDLTLFGFRKIPFTCAYLPGKANIHVLAGAYIIVLTAITDGLVRGERRALGDPVSFAKFLAVLCIAAVWARRRTRIRAQGFDVQFDQAPPADLMTLELRRDGVLPG